MALALEWNDARLRKELALMPPRAALGASMVFHGLGKLRGEAPQQTGKVHAKNGYDITKGGYEYNLWLMAIAAMMLVAGPGMFSVHEGLERLVEGRGARKWVRKARPIALLRLIKLLK